MALEIERKFLVDKDTALEICKGSESVMVTQGYFLSNSGITIRVRIVDGAIKLDNPIAKCVKAYLTIKGPSNGIMCDEYEYQIPVDDANEMLERFCGDRVIRKIRNYINVGKDLWEVDIFMARHYGLCLAEIELADEDEEVILPEWLGEEVTKLKEYKNYYLATH